MNELTTEKRSAYLENVAGTARTLPAVFKPDKVNYGACGDTERHLHFHLAPKYAEEYEWGGVFAMNLDIIANNFVDGLMQILYHYRGKEWVVMILHKLSKMYLSGIGL